METAAKRCLKVKTSVSLSGELLERLAAVVGERERSEFIEKALWRYLETYRRAERDRRDIGIINDNAERLNREALDVLSWQVPL